MLANTITVAVDENNTGTTTDHVFTRFDEFQNRSVYIGANHSPEARDNLTFYRTFPKQSGNFRGTCKSSFKISTDKVVNGADGASQIVAPVICEVSFSLPLGTTLADRTVLRQRILSLLDDDALMENLTHVQMV